MAASTSTRRFYTEGELDAIAVGRMQPDAIRREVRTGTVMTSSLARIIANSELAVVAAVDRLVADQLGARPAPPDATCLSGPGEG